MGQGSSGPGSGRRRGGRRIAGSALCALLAMFAIHQFPPATAQTEGMTAAARTATKAQSDPAMPSDVAARGVVYAGLRRPVGSECGDPELFVVEASGSCTHGPDPAPVGVDVHKRVAPLSPREMASPAATCDGDGVSGMRTQVVYARSSDRPDRFATYLASIRQWAAEADSIYLNSARETGGTRRIRFVHDAACQIAVANVVMSPTGDDDLGRTQTELGAAGHSRTDRKYMLFVDAFVYCGIGNILDDDSPGLANINNRGPRYGRTDVGCWGGSIAAHEHMHNLGGVQLSAPNTSRAYHCVDEYDRMCYSDEPFFPIMRNVCTDSAHEERFDCRHDDYFHTNPAPGSYLATHWNTANNQALIGAPIPAPTCQAGTPSTTGATRTSATVRVVPCPPGPGWNAPTSYRVIAYDGSTAVTTVDVPRSATAATMGGLTAGKLYRFRTWARNGGGAGPGSALSDLALPPFVSRDAFIDRQYLDFAGRPPTSGERTDWSNRLAARTLTPPAAIDLAVDFPNWAPKQSPVIRLFRAYFLRLPDPAGLNYWTNRLRSGTPLSTISQAFASSGEFQRRYGSLSNRGFVELLYRNVLNRAADPKGSNYWTGRLDNGASRGAVMIGFSESPEYRTKTRALVDVVNVYTGMLRRVPTTTEVSTWEPRLRTGTPRTALVASLLSSAAYDNRV